MLRNKIIFIKINNNCYDIFYIFLLIYQDILLLDFIIF